MGIELLQIAVPRYDHGGCSNEVGNLRVIGDMLVWNYLNNGDPLSWYRERTFNQTDILDVDDLLFSKKPPSTSLRTTCNISSSNKNYDLSNSDFEFTFRYVYDSGERSVIGQPFSLFKGRDDVEYITLSDIPTFPEYVVGVEVFARKGNSGVWNRIKSQSNTDDIVWRGELNEALDDDASTTFFHQVPLETKAIEIAKSYVFMANNRMDYGASSYSMSVAIDDSVDDYEIPSGTDVYSYFNRGSNGAGQLALPDNDNLSDRDNNDWVMPFASNSAYLVGIAFFDSRYRTKGVERFARFTSGNMAYPILPELNITTASPLDYPSWAEYYMICVTRNLTMDSFYEGFASDVFFMIEKEGITYYSTSADENNLSSIKYLVIDISAMLNEGHIYTWQESDRIILNRYVGGSVVTNEFLVVNQDGKYVYCDFDDLTEMSGMGDDTDSLNFDFIIYSPSQQTGTKVYYPSGELRPISELGSAGTFSFKTGTPSGNHLSRLIGDCIFDTVDYYPYLRSSLSGTEIEGISGKTIVGKEQYTYLKTLDGLGAEELQIDKIYESIDGGSLVSVDDYEIGTNITEGYLIAYFDLTINLPESIDLSLVLTVGFTVDNSFYDDGTKIKKQVTASSGDTQINVNFYHKVPIDADLLVGEELSISLLTQPLDSVVVVDCEFVVKNLRIEIIDSSKKVGAKKIDSDTPISKTPIPVLIRKMGNTKGFTWNISQGVPLLEMSDDPIRIFTSQIRHGGKYLQDIKLNNISNFTALRKGETPAENGPINVLIRTNKEQNQGNVMLAISDYETSSIYIEERVFRESGSTDVVALSDSVIGTVNELKGSYGTTHPRSVYRVNGNVYWWDYLEHKIIRYSRNGLDALNVKMQSYFRKIDGSAIAFYDPFYKMIMFWFEGDSNEDHAIAYHEVVDRWKTFVSYNPACSAHIDDYMFSAVVVDNELVLSRSLASSDFNNFYGENTDRKTKITFSLASPVPVVLTNLTIRHNSDIIDWATANNIKDNLLRIVLTNENGQLTTVYKEMLMLEKNMPYAHILRDENSPGGIIEGDEMEGYSTDVALEVTNSVADGHHTEQLAILMLSLGYYFSSGHKI